MLPGIQQKRQYIERLCHTGNPVYRIAIHLVCAVPMANGSGMVVSKEGLFRASDLNGEGSCRDVPGRIDAMDRGINQ